MIFLRSLEVIRVFKAFRSQNVFCLHENEKPAFSNSSSLMSVVEKLRGPFSRRMSVECRHNRRN